MGDLLSLSVYVCICVCRIVYVYRMNMCDCVFHFLFLYFDTISSKCLQKDRKMEGKILQSDDMKLLLTKIKFGLGKG